MTSAPRRIDFTVERQPFGWRSPQFQPLVLGTRRNARGRTVPRVMLKPYPVGAMKRWQEFAIPRMRAAADAVAASLGFAIDDETPLLRGAIALRVRAIVPRPRAEHRVRTGVPRSRSLRKPDLTNVVKLVEDCATAARWWSDDAAVAEQRNDAWVQETPPHLCVAAPLTCPTVDPPRVRVVAWELEPREE